MDKSIQRNGALVEMKFKQFFLPTVLMSASASLSLIVDSIIVGNVLGEDALAAMNLIMPVSLIFTACSAMFGIGSSSCIAALKGKMDHARADKCLTLSVIAWGILSTVGMLLGLLFSPQIARCLSGDSGLEGLVAQYLRVYLLGSPFTFFTLVFPHIMKANGRPRIGSNALIIANFVNLGLDVVLMQRFGIGGGAMATVIGNLTGCGIIIGYIMIKGMDQRFGKVSGKDMGLYGDMFKMSISSIFGQALMFGKIWIFNMLIAKMVGQEGLTAFSVCTSCLSFVSMFIAGGAQTMIPMVSAFTGAGDHSAVEMTVKKAMKLILCCCIGGTLLFQFFPDVVMRIYGVEGGEAMRIGVTAIRLFSLAFVGIGFSFMFMYYVQARKMPAFSMLICALEGFVIIVPLGILLAWLIGGEGIWLSYLFNEILVAGVILLYARSQVKKSGGRLHGIFMLERPGDGRLEASVELTDDQAVERLMEVLGNDETVKTLLQLSCHAYAGKGDGSRQWVDIILSGDTLSLMDMGMDHRLLPDSALREKLDTKDYEHGMMIGMNRTTVKLGGTL